ncbi:alpha-2-macroglobulin family protein [Mucilaginibacter lacusdianchii]|uniref:alpha-2-macroglobulin family protein n=1 Tax=Mucilaginibacter lacusdianchii TaxID=2684211 RepID=UPI00131D2290|nr:alpha-2-macroglobulin family protein [Mucilaginibacter sp. JXJ CY 39]
MSYHVSFIQKGLLIILLSCMCQFVSAQSYNNLAFRIDSLANIGRPKSALIEVDKLEQLARQNNNDAAQLVKVTLYRNRFQSYMQEDALATTINRLKTDIQKSNFPVKPVLQSLLAEVYWQCYKDNRWEISRRSRLENSESDFTRWDIQTLLEHASQLYQSSLLSWQQEQQTSAQVFDAALIGDKGTRYLRPTLYDLLLHRALDFYLSDEIDLPKTRNPFKINTPQFFTNSHTFANLTINTTDTASVLYRGLYYLQQGTQFHLKDKNSEALADLDIKRLKLIHDKASFAQKDTLYLQALKQVATSVADKPISADALVLIGEYHYNKDSLVTALYYLQKAIQTFPRSLGGQNAFLLIKDIKQQELTATVEDVNMPGHPLLALLEYRNLNAIRFKIFKLTEEHHSQLLKLNKGYDGNGLQSSPKLLQYLQRIKPVQNDFLTLPATRDYHKHHVEFKINPQTAGNYVLLLEDSARNQRLTQLVAFQLSSLAYTSRRQPNGIHDIRVLHRETGTPLKDVQVIISNRVEKGKISQKHIISQGLTNQDGQYIFKSAQNYYDIELKQQNDYLLRKDTYTSGRQYDDYNNLPAIHTIIFTDREIYRPGQTVYFKALQLKKSKGTNSLMPNQAIDIFLTGQYNKKLQTQSLRTNEFGSAAGSFVLPTNLLNGNFQIATAFGSANIRIEEYKRPTFQVTFLPVKQSYRLNDTVVLQGKVTAFSGYGISQARVAYHINLDYDNPKLVEDKYTKVPESIDDFETDTVTADNNGLFQIKFKAEKTEEDYSLIYQYQINATVTDGSGETQTAEQTVNVSHQPVKLDIKLPKKLTTQSEDIVPLKFINLNDQLLPGNIKVRVYALSHPPQVFKSRLWEVPDLTLLSHDDFKANFPDYAYQQEDDVTKWHKAGLILTKEFTADTIQAPVLNLQELHHQPSGTYQVIISGRSLEGDTVQLIQYLQVIKEPAPAQNIKDWVTPLSATIYKGGLAEFRIGINQQATVLMERYDGNKLLSAEWLKLNGINQQSIKVASMAGKNSIQVQFLMIKDNRLYTSYQNITVTDTSKKLPIRLLTYRNKLQPGQKEQWRLQVGNNGPSKEMAEMVATLYDAALDKITPATSWAYDLNQTPHLPDYFTWDDTELTDIAESEKTRIYFETPPITTERQYEALGLASYEYYYSQYIERTRHLKNAALSDKSLAALYLKNARLVNNGYDVIGLVADADIGLGLPNVIVRIKNNRITTRSNSSGYFRIKVPNRAILQFTHPYYQATEASTQPGERLTIMLKRKLVDLVTADPGQKSIKGDPTQTVRIDEPVGNAPVSYAVAESNAYGYMNKPLAKQVAFPPPITKQDEQIREKEPPIQQDLNSAEPAFRLTKPITLRKSFNETAFFYPQLHTDEKGQILMDFTMPDALTRWHFKAFAHTQSLTAGTIEHEAVTQKQLMISANMPRFLREGDTITVSARLVNLTPQTLKGHVQLQWLNAINQQPVNLLLKPQQGQQAFNIAGNSTKATSFTLIVPSGLDAVTYRLTAESAEHTDGEENTLPILSNRMLVTESVPMLVRAGQTRNFTLDKMVQPQSTTLQSKTLTLEYTQSPAWYAIQAMPYLIEFPYECAEQTFSRYFANSLAAAVISHNPQISKVFDRWKSGDGKAFLSNLEKNPELKTILLEETPWLHDAQDEQEQHKRIALLFDINKLAYEQDEALSKLLKMQLPDGGFPWFGGNRTNRYITQHIIAGVGQLQHIKPNDKLKAVSEKALAYLDKRLLNDASAEVKNSKLRAPQALNPIQVHAWYARSYYEKAKIGPSLNTVLQAYLNLAARQWQTQNFYEQGLIALTLHRYNHAEEAKQIVRSLLETAQQSDEMGMYWSKNRRGWFWYESPVETQSLMIELFTEMGNNAKAVNEMKIWLLRNKQTHNWATTKATAAACYALLMRGADNLLNSMQGTEIKLGGQLLSQLKPNLQADAGTGYIKATFTDEQIKPALANAQVTNKSKTISWGALHWQYTEQMDKISSSNTDLHLERKYFIVTHDSAGEVLTAIDAQHQPKTGDLLKVVVYLKAERDYEYIHLKDMRPAGTEPVDILSAAKYQDGLYYYQVSRDVATNFFIDRLNKGSYVLEYSLRAVQPGNFATGISTVQSMYAPEFNAHTAGSRLHIKP